MSEAGWTIERQTKSYGEHVKVTLGEGGLELAITASNPLRLAFTGLEPGVAVFERKLNVEPTRQNADKIGFLFSQLFETAAQLERKPSGAAVFELPAPAPAGRLRSLELPIEEVDEADLEPTVIQQRIQGTGLGPDMASPFDSKLPYYGG